MTKRTNIQTKIMATVLTMAMIFGIICVPAIKAEAATYQVGNQSLAINEGMATLTVNGNETIQLTRALVTKDGGIDASTGIVYLLWMSNSLYAYSYDLQKAAVQLVLVDTGVISLTTNGSAVTGYDTAAGHKNLLTVEEMKAKLGISNTNNNSSTGTTTNITGNGGTVPTNQQPANQQNTQQNTNQQQQTTTTTTTNVKPVLQNGVWTYTINGKTYTLATDSKNMIEAVYQTADGIIVFKYRNGDLNGWCYELQKDESKVELKKLDTGVTSVVLDSNGYITGYYKSGKSSVTNVLKVDAYRTKFIETKTNVNTKKYNMYDYVTGTKTKNLRDSNKKVVDKFVFDIKKHKLVYHGDVYNNVKNCGFTKKGKVAIIYQDKKSAGKNRGKCVIVNSSGKKVKTLKNAKSFKRDNGFVTYLVRKGSSKVKLSKY